MNTALYIGGAILTLWFIGGIYRHIQGKNKIVRVVESHCTGCGRCLKRCKHQVLEMVNDEKGKRVTVKYPGRCSGCGDCLGTCKFRALGLVKRG
jgi:ferredoxin